MRPLRLLRTYLERPLLTDTPVTGHQGHQGEVMRLIGLMRPLRLLLTYLERPLLTDTPVTGHQ
ncbi:unnamed protein product, partial [Closterium sp. NIES-53]